MDWKYGRNTLRDRVDFRPGKVNIDHGTRAKNIEIDIAVADSHRKRLHVLRRRKPILNHS